MHDDLRAAWCALGLPAASGDALLARWAQPHRSYHGCAHLRAVLRHVDTLAGHAARPRLVRIAAWYHDAVHDGTDDDEPASARLAEHELTALGEPDAAEVARLVLVTARHDPADDDPDGQVLCDADLAVLAGSAADYDAYTAAVRAEYAHVPPAAFRLGRAAVLGALLAAPSLFRTPTARAWEDAARANLTRELAGLR